MSSQAFSESAQLEISFPCWSKNSVRRSHFFSASFASSIISELANIPTSDPIIDAIAIHLPSSRRGGFGYWTIVLVCVSELLVPSTVPPSTVTDCCALPGFVSLGSVATVTSVMRRRPQRLSLQSYAPCEFHRPARS